MLQKIVNGIAIASGVISLTVVGTAGYVFTRKDAIIENVKGKIMEAVIPGGLGALGGGALGELLKDLFQIWVILWQHLINQTHQMHQQQDLNFHLVFNRKQLI